VAAANATYVGDSWSTDVVGALASGMRAIWLQRGTSAPRATPPQVRVVRTLHEIPDALASVRGAV
jgi:FMN phosphatase YigB (HAD superfamily)